MRERGGSEAGEPALLMRIGIVVTLERARWADEERARRPAQSSWCGGLGLMVLG